MRALTIALLAIITGCIAVIGDIAQAAKPNPSPPVTTSFVLPDGTVLYVRYGEPGGVRILNRLLATDSVPPTPQPVPSKPGEFAAPPLPAPSPGNAEIIARIREIIREELRRYESSLTRDRTAPAQEPVLGLLDAEVGTGLPRQSEPRPVTPERFPPAVIDARSAGSPPVTVSAQPSATDESEADSMQVADAGIESTPDSLEPTPDILPTPQVIRESILSEGLFRTNLILFETAQAVLLPHSRNVIQVIGDVLREFPQARIRIEGHADKRGPEDFNLELSLKRADAVRDFLLECCGLDPDRISTIGYGESRPLATGDSPTELAMNRRVEFRILNPEALRSTSLQPED
jgi:outer membrane protein OmpA-like peptidoglycan-associated protein